MMRTKPILALLLIAFLPFPLYGQENARKPENEAELKYWLENMLLGHRYSIEEIKLATGLQKDEIKSAIERFQIDPDKASQSEENTKIKVLPFPGGRHPRIGFLEGAIRPQRETKISVFLPWDPSSFVVVDVPEAIWSNLGLTYLAHTHIDTIWTKQGVELPKLEWERHKDGILSLKRELPNGIIYTARIEPGKDHLLMELTLTNGTEDTLQDLRVQNCVMLKYAKGFTALSNDNKVFKTPFGAVKSEEGDKWMIMAWQPCHRPWGNARVPCVHSDPKFPDCPPGKTVRVMGWLSFYEGSNLEEELGRISKEWQKKQ